MSRLIGAPGERWQLRRAVDALGDAARAAGRPGLLWLAAATYPSISTSVNVIDHFNDALTTVELRLFDGDLKWGQSLVGFHPALLLLAPVLLRLIVGLAAITGPAQFDAERLRGPLGSRLSLRRAWHAGRGLVISTAGLVFCVQLLVLAAALALVGPVLVLAHLLNVSAVSGPLILLMLPVSLLLLLYGVCLQVMSQLALHSLASNRRGAASALTHAWRLVRHSPWGTVRAGLVDVLLSMTVGAFVYALQRLLLVDPGTLLSSLVWVSVWLARGFEGVTRAGYWGRAYREFGGLAPVDGVPGLA